MYSRGSLIGAALATCGLEAVLHPCRELVRDLLVDGGREAAADADRADSRFAAVLRLDLDRHSALGEEPLVLAVQPGDRRAVERPFFLQARVHRSGAAPKRAREASLADRELRSDP